MTIRYEANPPKILPGVNLEESITKFIDKIELISKNCDAIHLTENVLGYQRASPIEIGKKIRNKFPHIPITVSLRVRDKNIEQVKNIVQESINGGFSGVLVLLGDPSQENPKNLGLVPSQVVKSLRQDGYDKKIDLYLSISSSPNFQKISKKLDATPKGFVTQVIQSIEQVKTLAKNLDGFSIIPIILFPSEKNQKSAEFLNLDFAEYRGNFEEFVSKIHQITGDVLLTSPSDFASLNEFLSKHKF